MTTANEQSPAEQAVYPRRWLALALLGLAQFILIVDVTVVAIALPSMTADLGLSREVVTWVVTSYTLTFGGVLLLGGRSTDLFGNKPILFTGLALFALGSLFAGLAPGGEFVLAGRVAQGLGAALLSPAAMSAVLRLFSGDERNRALGIWVALGSAGSAAGMLLGGLITAGLGWRWVFFINLPICLIILVGLVAILPPMKPPAGPRPRLDILGALLAMAATGTAIYSLTTAGEIGWTAPQTLLTLAGAAVLYLLFGWRQKTAKSPLMNLSLLTRRTYSAGTFILLIAVALMMTVFFLGTFYFQQSAGHGPLATGLLFLPIALATVAGGELGGRLVGKIGARTLGVIGLIIAGVGILVPVLWPTTTLTTTIGLTVSSFGICTLFVVASTTALGNVSDEESGIASGGLSTFHEIGASLGVATVSSLAAISLAGGGDDGYRQAFLAAAIAAAVSAVICAAAIPRHSRGAA